MTVEEKGEKKSPEAAVPERRQRTPALGKGNATAAREVRIKSHGIPKSGSPIGGKSSGSTGLPPLWIDFDELRTTIRKLKDVMQQMRSLESAARKAQSELQRELDDDLKSSERREIREKLDAVTDLLYLCGKNRLSDCCDQWEWVSKDFKQVDEKEASKAKASIRLR